ncbi:hypothetical protein GC105_13100 [Alkalibaculum sp. M08DMB]|uniref:Uncharacterized protein n=1 Tax=Alkalibaculum sporogenes TaxID=2655001 RepID=A0A6A7KBE1_9FIRM|nr:double-CXXCG motif protein [Alkalibaculum sporogenes]MPW26724.1 hypothetical protein [Alkalibaculum sporogenes]
MNFYRIYTDEGKRKKYSYGIIMNDNEFKKVECPVCNRTWEYDPLLDSDNKLKVVLGNSNYADFIMALYFELISQKSLNILLKENTTGWTYEEINTMSKEELTDEQVKDFKEEYGIKALKSIPNNPPIYYKILAKKTAKLHPRSRVILIGKCDVCGYEEYDKEGSYFDPDYIEKDSWNGDDIFGVKEYGTTMFCSERFVEIYHKHSLTGLGFDRIEAI